MLYESMGCCGTWAQLPSWPQQGTRLRTLHLIKNKGGGICGAPWAVYGIPPSHLLQWCLGMIHFSYLQVFTSSFCLDFDIMFCNILCALTLYLPMSVFSFAFININMYNKKCNFFLRILFVSSELISFIQHLIYF